MHVDIPVNALVAGRTDADDSDMDGYDEAGATAVVHISYSNQQLRANI